MYDPYHCFTIVSPQCQSWRCRWGCPLRPLTDGVIVASSLVTTAIVKKITMKRQHMAAAVAADPGYGTCPPPPVHHVPFVLTSTAPATPPSKASPAHPSPPLWFPTPSLRLPSPTVPPPPASVCFCRPRSGPADRWSGKTRPRTAGGNLRTLTRWLSSACRSRRASFDWQLIRKLLCRNATLPGLLPGALFSSGADIFYLRGTPARISPSVVEMSVCEL